MVCDAKGRPLRFALTGGQAADEPEATPLLDGIETGSVIADKGYESNRILAAYPLKRCYSDHTTQGQPEKSVGIRPGTIPAAQPD